MIDTEYLKICDKLHDIPVKWRNTLYLLLGSEA